MSRLSKYIGSQFGNPRGFIGKICCLAMNIINRKMYHSIANKLTDEKIILDIGYGNGYLISKIYKRTKAKIYGIDISLDMLKTATKRNQKGIEKGDIKLAVGDCCSLEFDDKLFDVVSTVNTIYFWSNTIKGLTEIFRVLKNNGVFYNAVYTKRWMTRTAYTKEGFKLFEKEEYIQMAKSIGFSSVEIIDIVEGTNFLIICKK